MIDAFWTITFQTQRNSGAGVLLLQDGRIFGGDTSFAFLGNYKMVGDKISAKIHVSKHSNYLENIFGIDEFDISLTGSVANGRMELSGAPATMPGENLRVVCTRKAEI